jgi:hypothetical protein
MRAKGDIAVMDASVIIVMLGKTTTAGSAPRPAISCRTDDPLIATCGA